MRALLMEHARLLERNQVRVEAVVLEELPGQMPGVALPSHHVCLHDPADSRALLESRLGPVFAVDALSALVLSRSDQSRGAYLVLDLESQWNSEPDEIELVRSSYQTGLPLFAFSSWVAEQVVSLAGGEVTRINRGALHLADGERAESDRPIELLVVDEGGELQHAEMLARAVRLAAARRPTLAVGSFGFGTAKFTDAGHTYFGASAEETGVARAFCESRCLLAVPQDELAVYRILQAMSYGCCVVTTASPRIADFCRDGENCLITDEPTAEAMAEAVERLGSDDELRGTVSSGARETAAALSTERHVAQLVGALDPEDASEATGSSSTRPSISVVIPAKNAGGEFHYLLQKLRAAEDDFDIETLVIDSGSTDDTVAIARDYGARVTVIPPEEFSHSGTRMRGSAMASGDYLLFMSQDVIPIGPDWLKELMRPLLDDARVAASHARDIPRSDADVFMCWLAWNAFRGRGWSADEIAGGDGVDVRRLSGPHKRSLSQLTDTCCLLRREVFDEFGFSDVTYGEDLDLGYRLLMRGYRLAHLHSVGVVHSHNRSAYYFLKRTYVDSVVVPKILKTAVPAAPLDLPQTVWAIRDAYSVVKHAVANCRLGGESRDVFTELLNRLSQHALPCSEVGDEQLEAFVSSLPLAPKPGRESDELLRRHLLANVADFADYYSEMYSTTIGREEELAQSIYKVFAVVVAGLLGAVSAADPTAVEQLGPIHEELCRGV